MSMVASTIGRIIFSLFLIWQIWLNAHWSVALSLTFLFIHVELSFWVNFAKEHQITPQKIDRAIQELVRKTNAK